MGPLVPLGFLVAYQTDLAYGNKMQRIIGQWVDPISEYIHGCLSVILCTLHFYSAEADSILAKERGLLALPGSTLSVDLVDVERKKNRPQ